MKSELRIADKILLSVDEACMLSGIGKNSMKRLVRVHPELALSYGQITKVKREVLEKFLLEAKHIDNYTTN